MTWTRTDWCRLWCVRPPDICSVWHWPTTGIQYQWHVNENRQFLVCLEIFHHDAKLDFLSCDAHSAQSHMKPKNPPDFHFELLVYPPSTLTCQMPTIIHRIYLRTYFMYNRSTSLFPQTYKHTQASAFSSTVGVESGSDCDCWLQPNNTTVSKHLRPRRSETWSIIYPRCRIGHSGPTHVWCLMVKDCTFYFPIRQLLFTSDTLKDVFKNLFSQNVCFCWPGVKWHHSLTPNISVMWIVGDPVDRFSNNPCEKPPDLRRDVHMFTAAQRENTSSL